MLDALDKAILQDLGANCRLSYQTLAKKHNVTATAIKKRIGRLIDSGVIADFTVELNLAMIDADYLLILIERDAIGDEEELVELIGAHTMVSEVGALAGSMIIAFASFQGAEDLTELRTYLKQLKGVKSVEMHTLLFPKGKKMDLKHLHLRVLRCLLEDPRMNVTDIAARTGLAARTVTRAINEILDGEGVRLSLRWNLNAGDHIAFLAKIEWDETSASFMEIIEYFRRSYKEAFWEPLVSASENIMFPAFVVESLKDVEQITHEIGELPYIKSVVTFLGKPSKSFSDLRRYRLEEMLNKSQ